MQPEVLAWALLFVVAFALVYRFFAWLGRSFAARADARPVAHEAERATTTPAVVAIPPTPQAEPIVTAAAIAAPPLPVATPPPQDIPPPIELPTLRTALVPSIAATLPPRPKPSVAATLPPRPLPSVEATLPPGLRYALALAAVPEAEAVADEVAVLPPLAAIIAAPGLADEATSEVEPAPPATELQAPKPFVLRARRLGTETESLDTRLRDARERKIYRTAKIVCVPPAPVALKELRVLVPKAAPEKTPARRIGQKAGDAIVLLSTKARTRIIGAAERPFRVLIPQAI
ncbi:MAG: hypothetical protein QM780_08285 [Hyphomicrobium sp.]|uniref:hypothetical protein n=1 Tax=Hyphomicrobium sp. TaxID=82 RepID=UPI0039E5D7FD